DVFQKDQVQHQALVGIDVLGLRFRPDGLVRDVLQRHDAVDTTRFYHPEAIDPENQIEQVLRVNLPHIAEGVERNRAGKLGGQDVVQLQLPRQAVHHFSERGVLQSKASKLESAYAAGSRSLRGTR